jgi:hypothetical protein
MKDWRWLVSFGLGAVWAFITHWFEIFIWAHVCLWELLTGQEVSCPECWKCSTARVILVIVYALTLAYGVVWLCG